LRAVSVFGDSFRGPGVTALLGGDRDAARHLAELVDGEILVVRSRSPEGSIEELGFRHALMREAAYAMLTEVDRRLGQRLAAEWLVASASADEVVVAYHFANAELWDHAARWAGQVVARAARLSRFSEALSLLEKAEAWLEECPDSVDRRRR